MNERLSAWMDGELESEQARPLLSQLKRVSDLRGDWDCYHRIGDTLRGLQGPDLCARICIRLDAEPTVLAPQHRSKAERLHRRPLQMVASIAALVFVGGIWMVLPGLQQNTPRIATIPTTEVKQAAVPADEGARGYLFAHQPYPPINAMQGLATYVRIISQEMPLHADQVIK